MGEVRGRSRPEADGEEQAERALTISRPEMLLDGSDSAFRQFIHDTLAFSARMQEISARLGSVIGMSETQYLVLIAIRHHQGQDGVGVNQIAGHLHLSAAFMTTEINKLVAAGLVRKKTNPHDRRRVLLTITRRAEVALGKLTAVQSPVNDTLFESLSQRDFECIRLMMRNLVASADRAVGLAAHLSSMQLPPGSRGRKP